MKAWIIFLIMTGCLSGQLQAVTVPAEEKIRLSEGWEFIRQDMADIWEVVRPAGKNQPQAVPLWQKVSLPHCFNAEDAVDPEVNYYQGPGWYRTRLPLNNPYTSGRILLEFEGAGQKTEVYVYTTLVGSHTGGYDGWKVDITDAVRKFQHTEICKKQFKGKIPIAVRCDNSRDLEMIPSDLSDFNLYGGLYRHVNLVYVPAVSFEQIRIEAKVAGKNGTLEIKPWFYRPEGTTEEGSLCVTLYDPAGKRIEQRKVQARDGSCIRFEVKRPVLWEVDRPELYSCRLELITGRDTLKALERFGFRYFEFREKGPFFLNGKRLLLRGTHRHEDHAGVGAAMSDSMIRREMKQMKEMGVNFIRLGHYQQSDLVLQLCDELGILVWEEIPWCRGGLGGKVYQEQARRMLTNMIAQHFNHASVILWGLGNEIDWPGDFEIYEQEAIRAFMKELNALAHRLDPGRMTAIRRCDFCKDIVDVYSPSIWAGWYSRAFTDFREMETKGMQSVPRFLHVEWGGDSHARRHNEGSYEGVRGAASTGDWSESYIVRLFDWHLKEQENMPGLTGTAFWTFKDFSTPLRPDNPIPYVNQKGVLERDGTPKESYYVFQSYWTRKPMIHIYGHSWPVRWGKAGEEKEVLVYSNCSEAELFVNGVSQGKKKRNSADFPASGLRWPVKLKEGQNALVAVGYEGKQQVEDRIEQEYQTASWGKEKQLILKQIPLGRDTIEVEALFLDGQGVRCLDSRKWVEFGFTGDGKLIRNQGTSTGSKRVQAYNGRAVIRVVLKGKGVVSVRAEGLQTALLSLENQ